MERPTVRIQNSTSPDRTKCYFLSIIINKLGSGMVKLMVKILSKYPIWTRKIFGPRLIKKFRSK